MLEVLSLALLTAAAVDPPPAPPPEEAVESSGIPPSEAPPSELSYSFAQATRVQVGSGLTVVSAESGTPTPRAGYAPLRVFVDNGSGPRQRMKLSYDSSVAGAPPVTKTIELAEGERRTVSLMVPSTFRYGRLQVRAPGVTEKGEEPIYFSTLPAGQRLVLSLGTAEEFERSVGAAASHTLAKLQVLAIPAGDAPGELAAYVGFDAVAIPKAGLESLSEGARRALEAYAATGGVVLAANAGRAMDDYFPLEKVDEGRSTAYGLGRVMLCASCNKLELGALAEAANHHEPAVVPTGVTETRRRHEETADALLPQANPPLGSFFAIISIFTLLIGPGSIFVARMRGPAALLFTIPGTAFVTCGLIVGSSILKDGFTVHAASYGYTELDSRRHRAITAGVTAYYANLSPSSARFDTLTAVLGSHESGAETYGAGMEWGESATAGSDFLPSRTYREWGFLSVQPTRARVVVKRNGTSLLVQNALGADVQRLTVSTKEGYFEVEHLHDGAEAAAQPVASPTSPTVGENVARRFRTDAWGRQNRPLAQGEFLAEVKGLGFLPSGGLRLDHHDSLQIVRGEVE